MGQPVQDLKWDQELADKAKTFEGDCSNWKHGSDYRFFVDGPDKNGSLFTNFLYSCLTDSPEVNNVVLTPGIMSLVRDAIAKNIANVSLFQFEMLNPDQNAIGCVQSQCTMPVLDVREPIGVSGSMTFSTLCLIGKKNDWTSVAGDRAVNALKKDKKNRDVHVEHSIRDVVTMAPESPAEEATDADVSPQQTTTVALPPTPTPAATTEASSATALNIALVLVISMILSLH